MGLAPSGDDHSRQRGSHQSCTVHNRGIECDGVSQMGSIGNHFHQKGLPDWDVKRIDQSQKEPESHQFPDDVTFRMNHDQDQNRLDHREKLRDEECSMPIPAICSNACEWREQQHRDLVREANQSQEKRRGGQSIEQPRHRHLLHPGPDQRDPLPQQKQSIIAMHQCATQRFQCHPHLSTSRIVTFTTSSESRV